MRILPIRLAGLWVSALLAIACPACRTAPPVCPDCPTCPTVPAAGSARSAPSQPNVAPVASVDLPRAGDFGAQQPGFVITLAATGELRVNGEPATDEQLLKAAKDARRSDPELRVMIIADQAVSWGRVIRVMDQVKQGGLAKFSFGVSASRL